MYVYNTFVKAILALVILFSFSLHGEKLSEIYGVGERVTNQELSSWNISIFPDGKNLPEGNGDYETGKALYAMQCMSCHGAEGKGGIKLDPYRGAIATLVKSKGDSLTSNTPKKNIGTYWQYAPSLFGYIRRTMPYQAPKSLRTNELYALTAYLLAENGIIPKDMVVNKENLPTIKMPNVNGFICDNRVDTKSVPCMKDCPLPSESDFNKKVILDSIDHFKSDCLMLPDIKF